MKNRRDYYSLLHVQRDAPLEIIKASYRTLMMKLKQHPDLGGSHEYAVLLNEAYATLSKEDRRAKYDRQQLAQSKKQEAAARPAPRPEQVQPSQRHVASNYLDQRAARNNRIVARIAQQCELRFFLSPHDQGCRGKMLDLSPKGISFTSPATLQLNQIIKIQSPVLQATARVVHCKTKRARWDTEHTIGVSFISVEFTRPRGTFVSVAA